MERVVVVEPNQNRGFATAVENKRDSKSMGKIVEFSDEFIVRQVEKLTEETAQIRAEILRHENKLDAKANELLALRSIAEARGWNSEKIGATFRDPATPVSDDSSSSRVAGSLTPRQKVARMRDEAFDLLRRRGGSMPVQAIHAALIARGVEITGAGTPGNVTSNLRNDDRFVNDSYGMWTIKELPGRGSEVKS